MPDSNVPAWIATVMTVDTNHMVFERGAVIFGERPRLKNGNVNHDWIAHNDAAEAVVNRPGPSGFTCSLISKPPPDRSLPPPPYGGMELVSVSRDGSPVYAFKKPDAPPEVEEPKWKCRASHEICVAGVNRQPGEIFSAAQVADHERGYVEPLNNLAHDALLCRQHPDLVPAESVGSQPVNTRTAYDPFRRNRP